MPRTSGSHRRFRIALTAVAAVAGIGSLAALSAMSVASTANNRSTSQSFDPSQAAVLLHRVGITPQAMAAVGMTGEQVDAVCTAALAYQFGPDLGRATKQLAQSRQSKRPVRPGDSGVQAPAIDQRVAEASLKSQLDKAFNFVTVPLMPSQVEKLANIRTNAEWELPVHYLTVTRTPEEWVALRNAIGNARFATTRALPVDPADARVLDQMNADPTVSAAKDSANAWIELVTERWDSKLRRAPAGHP